MTAVCYWSYWFRLRHPARLYISVPTTEPVSHAAFSKRAVSFLRPNVERRQVLRKNRRLCAFFLHAACVGSPIQVVTWLYFNVSVGVDGFDVFSPKDNTLQGSAWFSYSSPPVGVLVMFRSRSSELLHVRKSWVWLSVLPLVVSDEAHNCCVVCKLLYMTEKAVSVQGERDRREHSSLRCSSATSRSVGSAVPPPVACTAGQVVFNPCQQVLSSYHLCPLVMNKLRLDGVKVAGEVQKLLQTSLVKDKIIKIILIIIQLTTTTWQWCNNPID